MGPNNSLTGYCDDPVLKGLIPRIIDSIFEHVQSADPSLEFTIQVSYLEIYLEKLKDLLDRMELIGHSVICLFCTKPLLWLTIVNINTEASKNNLLIKEDKDRGIHVAGLTEEYVTSASEVFDLMKIGASNRVVSSTRMNAESSRSHSIFIITLNQKDTAKQESRSGKLFLVDLAGSEKVKKTGAEGILLEEAKNINKSLSVLGNVINSLTDGKSSHIPYRDSKLTRLLQDSLGGNSRTTLIINCSSSSYNEFESISTLRFGTRYVREQWNKLLIV